MSDSICIVTPRSESVEYTHTLVIRDFVTVVKDFPNGEKFRSDTFNIPLKYQSLPCWFNIFPSGVTDEEEGYVSLYLNCQVTDMSFKISWDCKITDSEENYGQCKEEDSSVYKKKAQGYSKFIEHTALFDPSSKFLNQGNMTLVFKIDIQQNGSITKSSPSNDKGGETNKHHFTVMRRLLEDPLTFKSDFVIECMDSKEVHCHSNILNAASEYFENMFATNSKEKQDGRVFIEDLSKETCDIILKYIYTGELDKKLVTFELYKQANYLRLIELRDLCSNYLALNLNTDDVIDIILYADGIKDIGLKEACADFIEQNSKKLDLKKIKDVDLLVELYERKGK